MKKEEKKRGGGTAYTCQASREPGAVPRLLNDLTYPPRQAREVAALASVRHAGIDTSTAAILDTQSILSSHLRDT